MHAQTQDLPFQVAEDRPENAALPAGFTTDRHPLCWLSPLCGGTLPLVGSLIAFAALAAVAVVV